MDTEIPKLGSESEPVDYSVWGTAYGISVKKTRMAVSENSCHPRLIPEAGCGQNPQKGQ